MAPYCQGDVAPSSGPVSCLLVGLSGGLWWTPERRWAHSWVWLDGVCSAESKPLPRPGAGPVWTGGTHRLGLEASVQGRAGAAQEGSRLHPEVGLGLLLLYPCRPSTETLKPSPRGIDWQFLQGVRQRICCIKHFTDLSLWT